MGTEYNAGTGTVTTDGASLEGSSSAQANVSANTSAEFHAASDLEVEGDILSTARSSSGSPVVGRQVQASDTTEAHGYRMTTAIAVQMGFLKMDAGGNYVATVQGTAGAKSAEAPKGKMELASGGTAEEAAEANFTASPQTEEVLGAIIAHTSLDNQLAAINSYLWAGGAFDAGVIERLASQAETEPEEMAEALQMAVDGMQDAVMKRLAPLGVYDANAFGEFLQGNPETYRRMIDNARDLMMSNSTKGFETLAQEFAMTADRVDPVNVETALEYAGIPFTRMDRGGVLTACQRTRMKGVAPPSACPPS